MFDDRGDEFWTKVTKEAAGRAWRETKAAAVEAIEAAIERGDPAGEVVVDGDC